MLTTQTAPGVCSVESLTLFFYVQIAVRLTLRRADSHILGCCINVAQEILQCYNFKMRYVQRRLHLYVIPLTVPCFGSAEVIQMNLVIHSSENVAQLWRS